MNVSILSSMHDKNLDAVDVALARYVAAAVGMATAAAKERPAEVLDFHAKEMDEGRQAFKAALKAYVEAGRASAHPV